MTRHLSNELGEPESFWRIHEIVHSLARSREAKTSEIDLGGDAIRVGRIHPTWDVHPALQVECCWEKGQEMGYVEVEMRLELKR